MTVITRLASGLILADQTVVRATLTFSLALLSIFIFGYLQEKPIKARCALILGTNSTFRLSASDTRPLIIAKPETELTFFTDTFLKTISTVINSLVAFLLANRLPILLGDIETLSTSLAFNRRSIAGVTVFGAHFSALLLSCHEVRTVSLS